MYVLRDWFPTRVALVLARRFAVRSMVLIGGGRENGRVLIAWCDMNRALVRLAVWVLCNYRGRLKGGWPNAPKGCACVWANADGFPIEIND